MCIDPEDPATGADARWCEIADDCDAVEDDVGALLAVDAPAIEGSAFEAASSSEILEPAEAVSFSGTR